MHVQLGALRQVVPETLSFCWSIVREQESMADAELKLELVAAEVLCRPCNERSEITSRWAVRCPLCEGGDVEVLHGEEFLVTSLDVS